MESQSKRATTAARLTRFAAAACFIAAASVAKSVADWHGLTFYLFANFFAGCYSFLFAFLPTRSKLWKTIVLFDVIFCIFISSSVGVGWQTYKGIKAIYGDDDFYRVDAVCGFASASAIAIAPKFCSKILASFILSTIGFVINCVFLVFCICISTDALLCDS